MNSLIDQLSSHLKAVKPLTSVKQAALAWIMGSTVSGLILFAAFLRFRSNWDTASRAPSFWLSLICLFITLCGYSIAAIRSGLPGQLLKRAPQWLGSCALIFFFLNLIAEFLTDSSYGSILSEGGDPQSGIRCALKVLFLAALPASLLIIRLRRTAPIHPRRSGLWIGLAAGAFGALGLAFCCPSENPVHLLLWHGLPILALSWLCSMSADRFLKW